MVAFTEPWSPRLVNAVNIVDPPVPPLDTVSVPVTPVVNGRPVKLVATPDAGVPSAGATNTGLFDRTRLPVPVSVVVPVPPPVVFSTPPDVMFSANSARFLGIDIRRSSPEQRSRYDKAGRPECRPPKLLRHLRNSTKTRSPHCSKTWLPRCRLKWSKG